MRFVNEGINNKYQKNKKILEEAIPPKITIDHIHESIKSPTIQKYKINGLMPIKDKFIQWATGCDIEKSPNREDSITDYSFANITRDDIPETVEWCDIVDYINSIKLPIIKNESKNKKEQIQLRTMKQNDRKEAAEKLFDRFIHYGLTEQETKDFVEYYNRTQNAEKAPNYAKLPLFINGMNLYKNNKKFTLYEQQIKGISFLVNKGNGIIAYDVGLGKTAIGIVATVQQMQNGRCHRPIIIVPKSVVPKWENDIHELFPNIPVINLGNMNKENVAKYYDGNHGLNIPENTITLASKEALNNIVWKESTITNDLFDDYASILSLRSEITNDDQKTRLKAREKILQAAGVANTINKKTTDYIFWENTGFDQVTFDEAHAYKNLFKIPRAKDPEEASEFANLGTGTPSIRALRAFNIAMYTQIHNNNRNIFMLTATPFTNNPLEVYSMLIFINRKLLEKLGIKDCDSFLRKFAKTRNEMTITKGGTKIESKNIMKEWEALPVLQNILKSAIDKVDGEEQEKNSIDFVHSFVRPEKKTHTIYLQYSELQKKIFKFATAVLDYQGDNKKEKIAPMLEGISFMQTACVSPALLKPDKIRTWINRLMDDPIYSIDPKLTILDLEIPSIKEIVECSPKLKFTCDTIISNWKAHRDCGQIIYTEEGTSAFDNIIDYMKKQGIPAEVFATIDGSDCKIGGHTVTEKMIKQTKNENNNEEIIEEINTQKRAYVADRFNNKHNPCKILIGSQAIREGMDLNGNSIALYNLTLGWNPTDDIQVEGRIWRQGNKQGIVHIVYPLIYDSIDALLYQKHDEKNSRIKDLMSYKGDTLNVEAINPAELKYALIKNPKVRAKLEIDEKIAVLNKELIKKDNCLKTYDQLIGKRKIYRELTKDTETNKQKYIDNHRESIIRGSPNRSEEEQKIGEERYNKAIKKQNEISQNIQDRLASLGIYNYEDERNYSTRISNEKNKIQEEIEKTKSHENIETTINKALD